jgi:hypothetical protein
MPVNIPEFPNKRARYPGLYCISEAGPNHENKNNFRIKIGMSINMRKRLQNYHTCWPYGFYIYGLVFCMGKTKKEILKLEKELFEKIIRKNPNYYLRTKEISGAKEYFNLPIKKLKEILVEFGNEHDVKSVVDFKDEYVEKEFDEEEDGVVLDDNEYRSLIDEIENKAEERKANDDKAKADMDKSIYKDRLRKRVKSVKEKLKELEQAQIDYEIRRLRK